MAVLCDRLLKLNVLILHITKFESLPAHRLSHQCAMADSNDTKTADAPGIGMRLTIASIAKKFSSVKNMTTETLASLIKKNVSGSQTTITEGTANTDLLILTNEKYHEIRDTVIYARDAFGVDSRPNEEFVISHIPGAIQVDYEASRENIVQSVPRIDSPETKTIVCYCSVGYRSCMVAEKIEKHFKTKDPKQTEQVKVYNLEGSLFKWANEGRPMVDINSKPTKYAHPYNAVFGKLLNSELRKKILDTTSNI